MKIICVAILIASACMLFGQQPLNPQFDQNAVRWFATTGDVSLNGAGTTATIQQPATGAQQVQLEQIVVYCSVACNVTQTANGTAATATAGTIQAILPNPLSSSAQPVVPNVTFWTASNVGAGTAQAGIFHIGGLGTQDFCLSTACGALRTVYLAIPPGSPGGNANYSVTISSITGTANITFYGLSQ